MGNLSATGSSPVDLPRVSTKRKSVALLIETSNAYARGLMDGIVAYQRQHARWSIYMGEHERRGQPPYWLREWKGDGIIARIETKDIANEVKRLNVPTVDVSKGRLLKSAPCIETNDAHIAELAASHLYDRGFTTLAYCGEPVFEWSRLREQSFVDFCKKNRCIYSVFRARAPHQQPFSSILERRRLRQWIKKLPKPVGVMACYDFKGQEILDICRELEISVPEHLSVIGVDNDERLCRLCTPELSSVIPDAFGAGFKAAKVLHDLMSGKEVKDDLTLLPPLGIAERRSSDIYAIDDEEVITAVRFIHEHACEGITIADLLKVVPLSRRALEYRFRRLLRCTPHQKITRIRIERAKQLLLGSELPLNAIAIRSGFSDADYLSVAFKKFTGVPPSEYRKRKGNTSEAGGE